MSCGCVVFARDGGGRAGVHPRTDPRQPGHRRGERQPRRPPSAVDGDMLAVALRRREAEESVTSIARHLGIGRSTLYRTLAAYDEAAETTAGRDATSR
ncbi:helix-turn-helix domain-containing protein [Streptomyces sp. NBC_00272]|uniref:helix-turn-helix domain-containing protein n=1 Tax=Streptomyces sp. NBC_00272 TaxID=2975698 RepID=UPI002E2E0232|nr:helix-turn-helix domain-containing protein [Streptomyces sp. NBC_00272]